MNSGCVVLVRWPVEMRLSGGMLVSTYITFNSDRLIPTGMSFVVSVAACNVCVPCILVHASCLKEAFSALGMQSAVSFAQLGFKCP